MAEKSDIGALYSRLNVNVLTLLKKQGYIKDYHILEDKKKKHITINLLYNDKKPAVTGIKILSKPGRRTYKKLQEVRPVLGGLGMSVISTSAGIMSDREARENKRGGEALFKIW